MAALCRLLLLTLPPPRLGCGHLRPPPAGISADPLPQLLPVCWQSPGFRLVLLTVHVLWVILATLTASMSPGLKTTRSPCLAFTSPQAQAEPRGGATFLKRPQHLRPDTLTCSSVTKSCPALCTRMDCSTPASPVLHYLPKLAQTHVHLVGDAIQPSHPLSLPSPPALSLFHGSFPMSWLFASGGQSCHLSFSSSF